MQEEESNNMCQLINYLLSLNQRFDLALKPPRKTVKTVLLAVAISIFNSKWSQDRFLISIKHPVCE